MNRKNKIKAIIAIAIALAFIMPVAVVANDGTIGVTSDSEITNDLENILKTSTNNDISDNIEIASDDEIPFDEHELIEDPFIDPAIEDPVIDAEELPIVIDDTIAVLSTGITIYVDDDFNSSTPGWGVTHFDKVKDGVVAASAGDTVYIYNGTYNEYGIQVNKQLNIIGESRENTIINGGTSYSDVMKITADYVNISTLTMKRSASGGNNILLGDYSNKVANIIIKDCNVDNTVKKGDGIDVYYSVGSIDIINCEVYNTKNAIYFTGSLGPLRIINCTIHDNTGWGITLMSSYYPVAPFLIKNCTSYNNYHGIFIRSMAAINGKGGDIIGCTTYDNRMYSYSCGISVYNSDYVNIVDCVTYNNSESGIGVDSNSENCNITDCTSYNNGYGIYLDAYKCYLARNTMYDNTYNLDIDGSLDHIIDPTNTVGGLPVYYLNGEENRTLDGSYTFGFLGLVFCNNVTVKDNSAAEGLVVGYSTNLTLYNMSMRDLSTGFYIYASDHIKIEKCTAYDTFYGFHLKYTDRSEITDCAVEYSGKVSYESKSFFLERSPYNNLTNCTSYTGGAGLYLKYDCDHTNVVNFLAYNGTSYGITTYSSPWSTFVNCHSHHNQHGIYIRSTDSTIIDFVTHDNQFTGIQSEGAGTEWINCTTYNNGDEGIALFRTTDVTFTNWTSYDNRDEGVKVYDARENNFLNCEFYNNSRDGIYVHYRAQGNTFTNCKVHDNNKLLDSYGNPIGHGILIGDEGDNSVVTDCEVYNNNYGIYINKASNNILRGNTISNNNHDFDVVGSIINDLYQDIDTSNTINGDPIYYLVDEENMTIGTTYAGIGYLRMVSCNNMTAQNLDISGVGLMMIRTTNSTLSNIEAHDGKGIHLWESSYNDVTGCTVYNNIGHGIYLQDSPNNDITSCTAYNNTGHGIYLLNSPNNILRSNILSGNAVDFGVTGTLATDFIQDIDESNLVDGDPMWYLIGNSDEIIDETDTFGYLALVSCDNMTLQNLDVGDLPIILTTNSTLSNIEAHDGKDGIYLWESSYNEITGCTIYNHTGHGIYLRDSHNNIIKLCDAYNNGNGFYLTGSSYNDLIQCKAYSNTYGFYLTGSTWNNIMVCEIYDNSNGIYLKSSNNNNIILCKLHDNSNGIYLYTSTYCNIENCDIFGNSNGVHVYGSYNVALYNIIKECKIHGNSNGIYYNDYCKGSIAVNNTIYDNNYGIYYLKKYYNKGNKAYHNTLTSNAKNAYSYYTNEWDDGYPSGGNYWDDYTGDDFFHGPSQNITGSDGIGDTPYVLGRITDHYPLMNPPGGDITPPEIKDVVMTNSTPIDTDPVFGWEKVTCNVIDAGSGVNDVKLVVTYPNASIVNFAMIKNGNTYSYETTFTDAGDYTYHIWANDTNGHIAVPSPEQTFVLPENWDMNDDRVCDISDLRMVALQFGETGLAGWIREDYNNDGVCDISDLRMVALQFGATY